MLLISYAFYYIYQLQNCDLIEKNSHYVSDF